jgi:hypothetical protein
MHTPITHAIDLATAGYSVLFTLFAAGFAVGTTIFFAVAKTIDRRYAETFISPHANIRHAATFPGKKIEHPRKVQPIEIELEAMELHN